MSQPIGVFYQTTVQSLIFPPAQSFCSFSSTGGHLDRQCHSRAKDRELHCHEHWSSILLPQGFLQHGRCVHLVVTTRFCVIVTFSLPSATTLTAQPPSPAYPDSPTRSLPAAACNFLQPIPSLPTPPLQELDSIQ